MATTVLKKGTELKGTTTGHPGRIVIIGISAQNYHVRFKGGQHNSKAEARLAKHIVDRFYQVTKQPKKA